MAIPNQDLNHFAEQFPLISIHSGTKLFRLERVPESFLFLKSGCVKMSLTNNQGDLTTLHVFYPGACVSLLSLVEEPTAYDFESLTSITAYRIPRQKFIDFLQSHPVASFTLLTRVLKGMDGLLLRVRQTATASAYQRVASLLVYFTNHLGSNSPHPIIELSLTHQDIAEWLGLTRENVSIQMKKLEQAGLIRRSNHLIEVKQLAKMHNLAEQVSVD